MCSLEVDDPGKEPAAGTAGPWRPDRSAFEDWLVAPPIHKYNRRSSPVSERPYYERSRQCASLSLHPDTG